MCHFIKVSLTLVLTLFLISCQESNRNSQVPLLSINPVKETVMEGLKRPWSMAFLNNDEALLAEKDGHLLKVNLKTKDKTIIKGFPSDLADSLLVYAKNYPLGTFPSSFDGVKGLFNAGIFDVKLDPDFKKNQWIYISYVCLLYTSPSPRDS